MRSATPQLLLVSALILLLRPAAAHRPLHGAHIPGPLHDAHVPGPLPGPLPCPSDDVLTICSKTRDAALCQSSIAASLPPPLETTVTPAWVLEKHIRALTNQTQTVMDNAEATCKQPNINESVVTALRACLTGDYAGSMNALDRASQRLAIHDVPALNIELSAVLSGYSYCDDEFVEVPYSPVMASNEKLTDAARILLDLATLV